MIWVHFDNDTVYNNNNKDFYKWESLLDVHHDTSEVY